MILAATFCLLAAAPPVDSSALGSWVSIALLIVVGLTGIINIGATFVTRREIDLIKSSMDERMKHLEGEVTKAFARMGGIERGAGDKLEGKAGDLQEDITRLTGEISAIQAEARLRGKTLDELHRETAQLGKLVAAIASKLNVHTP